MVGVTFSLEPVGNNNGLEALGPLKPSFGLNHAPRERKCPKYRPPLRDVRLIWNSAPANFGRTWSIGRPRGHLMGVLVCSSFDDSLIFLTNPDNPTYCRKPWFFFPLLMRMTYCHILAQLLISRKCMPDMGDKHHGTISGLKNTSGCHSLTALWAARDFLGT